MSRNEKKEAGTRFAVVLTAFVFLLGASLARGQLTYATNQGTLTVTGYSGTSGIVTIPSEVGGLPVVDIGTNAFSNTQVGQVTIPASVTNIGQAAFYNCPLLVALQLTDGLKTIGTKAAANCQQLGSVTIPGTVRSVGDLAFGNCPELLSVTLTNGLQKIGVGTFGNDPNLQSISIPATVTNIGQNAFLYSGLTNAIVLGTGSTIGVAAFQQCSNLENVTISNGVVDVAMDAFEGCRALTRVSIANTVTNIDDEAFAACESLTTALIGGNGGVIGDQAFYGDTSLTTLVLSNGIASIGSEAFYQAALLSVNLPGSVTNIGPGAFAQCPDLSSVTLSSGITSVGEEAFEECSALASVSLPVTLGNIDAYAFEYCPALQGLEIPNSVTNIGAGAFSGCSSLTTITIPAHAANIGQAAFVDCFELTAINVAAGNPVYSSVNGVLFDAGKTTVLECPAGLSGTYSVPTGVTSIANGAFQDCKLLTGVALPATVKTIGVASFNGSGLINITIPAGVTSLGPYSFGSCANLTGVFCEGSPPTAGSGVFLNSPAVTVYYFPTKSGWSAVFGGAPTEPWPPTLTTPNTLSAGAAQFSFVVTWFSNVTVTVEASTNLVNPVWTPLQTVTISNGSGTFSDPQWKNYEARYYRVKAP